MKNLIKIGVVMLVLVVFVGVANATAIEVSMGQVWGVNGDSIAWHTGGDPTDTTKGLLDTFNSATVGNTNAFELVVDMGEVKNVVAILTQNRPFVSYGVPWDIRVYVAADEAAAGFDYSLASSYTQELTSGRTMLTPNNADANVWKSWTLPTATERRYIKIDITGLGFGGVNSTRTLTQFQDLDATYVPEPATVILLSLGGLVLRCRRV